MEILNSASSGMGFIFSFVLQLGIFLPFTILYEGLYFHSKKRGLFYLVLPLGFALILYVLGGWAALCATRTLIFEDYATHGWFHCVVGFSCVSAPSDIWLWRNPEIH